MRIEKKDKGGILEGDLTPMIDMTFQLIAFFMVLINFTQSEQHEKVLLPDSVLAKPQKGPLTHAITIHMTVDGKVVVVGRSSKSPIDGVPIDSIKPYLTREIAEIKARGFKISDATISIRAHKDTDSTNVLELIKECKASDFTVFKLVAKEDVGNN